MRDHNKIIWKLFIIFWLFKFLVYVEVQQHIVTENQECLEVSYIGMEEKEGMDDLLGEWKEARKFNRSQRICNCRERYSILRKIDEEVIGIPEEEVKQLRKEHT